MESGEICTGQIILQPIPFKSDGLLGHLFVCGHFSVDQSRKKTIQRRNLHRCIFNHIHFKPEFLAAGQVGEIPANMLSRNTYAFVVAVKVMQLLQMSGRDRMYLDKRWRG